MLVSIKFLALTHCSLSTKTSLKLKPVASAFASCRPLLRSSPHPQILGHVRILIYLLASKNQECTVGVYTRQQ